MAITTQHIGRPINGKTVGQWVKEMTISTAERVLREEVSRGFDTSPVVVTDGMPRRDYKDVKPFGKIEFIARSNMADAVRWALSELQKRSPMLTGRYVSSHVVMINNVEVKGNIWAALRAVKPGDKVQIVNPQPYARKIEGATAARKISRRARRGTSRQARNGVYRPVLRALVERFGKSMFFDFKYVKLTGSQKVWGQAGGRGRNELPARQIIRGKGGHITGWTRPGRTALRDQVFPALQFFIKPN